MLVCLRLLNLALPCYRYEPDMLAFTGCDYGGGRAEAQQFGEIRQRWPSLKQLDPEEQRAKGLCVVSPEEVRGERKP